MDLPIRWGVIGCGNVTEVKSTPAFQQVEGFTVNAVLARDVAKVSRYIKRHTIAHGFIEFDEFIQHVDAVYIATPPDSHLEYAWKVLKHKKPCCIEKPISNNSQEAANLVDAYQQENIPLFVSYYRRSLPRFLEVKQWLDQELIGTIRHVSWRFTKPANEFDLKQLKNWRTESKVAPGGYFDDLASHGIDLFGYLLGNIASAKGVVTNQQNLYSACDSVAGVWVHDNGITGSGFWNFGAFERLDEVEIIGSEGCIKFSVFLEAPISLKSKNDSITLEIANPKHIQLCHAENIKDALVNGVGHPSTGATALQTNLILDQIKADCL